MGMPFRPPKYKETGLGDAGFVERIKKYGGGLQLRVLVLAARAAHAFPLPLGGHRRGVAAPAATARQSRIQNEPCSNRARQTRLPGARHGAKDTGHGTSDERYVR